MEKKISVGIIIIGIIDFVIAIQLWMAPLIWGYHSAIQNFRINASHLFPHIFGFLLAAPLIYSGVAMLKRKSSGRKINILIFIGISLVSLLYRVNLFTLIIIFILLFSVYYLMLPKVKEQFK